MPEQPSNQALNAVMIGDLNELLQKPFHFKGTQQTVSGTYQAIGLAVGKSWQVNRRAVALVFPFVPEADPTDATAGTMLLPYGQARVWLDFTGPNGDERLTFRIWHRHVEFSDITSFGPWTMWKEIDNAQGRYEYLDSGNFHREIYIQLMGYGPATATATAVTVWVAGSEGLSDSSDMDVNIDAGNLEVQIEAIPDDFGEKADSAIMAGTTDGIVPQAAGGNPTGTFAFRVMPDGRMMSWLTEPTLTRLSDIGDATSRTADVGALVRTMSYGLERASARLTARTPFQAAMRKVVGIDGGASTVTSTTTISFTGINLVGRVEKVYDLTTGLEHDIVSVVDPVPPAAGTITLRKPLWAATDTVLIPYTSVPHAYETTTDALRMKNVAPEWSHYVEPMLFLPASITANGTTQYGPIPCLDYDRYHFEIVWTAGADPRTILFNVYGKQNPNAWAGAGLIPAAYLLNSQFTKTPGSQALGGPPTTGGIIVVDMEPTKRFESLMVEMVVTNNAAGAATVLSGYYGLK